MLKKMKRNFFYTHFKKTVAASSLIFGLAFAYAFTAFSITAIGLSVFLAFMPSYYLANRFHKKFDKSDIWKNILAAENARYVVYPEPEKTIDREWRNPNLVQVDDSALDIASVEENGIQQDSAKSKRGLKNP